MSTWVSDEGLIRSRVVTNVSELAYEGPVNSIPNVIHVIWLGASSLHFKYHSNMVSFTTLHPECTMNLWTGRCG
jgi:hypothetical protein